MDKPFGWAYIGCGGICASTAKAILPGGKHKIVRAFSRNPEHARAFVNKFGGQAAASLEEAVLDPDVEGVYIGTPHNSHMELAAQALRLGKPVLVEKPGAVNASQWDALCTLAKDRNLYLCEAMWTRFSPTSAQVRRWITEGRIGDVVSIRASFATWPKGVSYPERLVNPELAGGVLLDMGIYPLTYAHMLLGMPEELRCEGKLLDSGVDGEETMTLTYKNGAVCTLYASVLHMRPPTAVIHGTRGTIRVPGYWFGKHAVLRSGVQWKLSRPGGGYQYEFDKAASDIRRGLLQSSEVPHAVTKEMLELMDRCREQMGVRYPFE